MKRLMVAIFLMGASVLYAGQEEHRQIVEYLQLTPAQQTAWQNAHDAFNTATEPLLARIRQIGHDNEVALKSASPDACAIGNAMIAQQQVVEQLKAQKTALQQKLESVLTPDQKTRFEAFQAAQPRMMMERHKISE